VSPDLPVQVYLRDSGAINEAQLNSNSADTSLTLTERYNTKLRETPNRVI
jgi:hypothetical protein